MKAFDPWGGFEWGKLDALQKNGWKVQFFSCPERNFDAAWQDDYNAIVISKRDGLCYFVTVNQQLVAIDAETVNLPHKN